MHSKKVSLFVLVSFLLAVSAQAQDSKYQQYKKVKQLPLSAQTRLADIAKQALPDEIKGCQPVCPLGYSYSGYSINGHAIQAQKPTQWPWREENGYWYNCKVNSGISIVAQCPIGFVREWLDGANAYDCVCANVDVACRREKEQYSDASDQASRDAATAALHECILQICPSYSISLACPNGFTYKNRNGTDPAGIYTCVLPGYVADEGQPNSWSQGFCSASCVARETVTDIFSGTITCLKKP